MSCTTLHRLPDFAAHPAETQKLAGAPQPELAAWTMLSNVLLNLDETMTKE
jgi:hypothetical protein